MRRHKTRDDVRALLKAPPHGFAGPDAEEMILQYGLEAVEGAAFRTLAQLAGGARQRSQQAVTRWALKHHRWWDAEALESMIEEAWQEVLRSATRDAERNPTLQRLLQEAERPANVTRLERRA
jgi:hypothetical protein